MRPRSPASRRGSATTSISRTQRSGWTEACSSSPFLGFGPVDVTPLVGPGGGVHRNLEDSYYGGGEWLLLTALLGLAEPADGDERLEWVAAHAAADGSLPEQSHDHLLHAEAYDDWVAKWGPPPSPLLWSHAMFLTLDHVLHGG
jgi:hypothetical protein